MTRMITFALLLVLILTSTTALAQYREGAVLVTLDAGGTMAKSNYSGDMVNGTAAGFTFDKVLADGKFNVGASLVWLQSDETAEIEEGETGKVTYSSTPFRLTGRWNFLNGKFAANVGLGLGIHTSNRKLYEGTVDEKSESVSGFNFGVPVTVAFFLDPDFYLTAIYSPSWMSGSYADGDLAHALMFGLGFQWGASQN